MKTVPGTLSHAKLPLVLLSALTVVALYSVHDPVAGRLNWILEVGPGLLGIVILAATYRKFPFSHLVYACVFLHVLILIYGGHYTYAETPLGNWARDAFGLGRNHYDRVGHVALGFFPALIIREILLRASPLGRGGWLFFIVVSIAVAIGAIWEILEWWSTLIVSPDVGQAFLGSQGDVWDAQWDMLLALLGAVASLLLLSGIHDRSMRSVLRQ